MNFVHATGLVSFTPQQGRHGMLFVSIRRLLRYWLSDSKQHTLKEHKILKYDVKGLVDDCIQFNGLVPDHLARLEPGIEKLEI